MTDGIFESISQRIGREETQENRRIQEIADELRRRCCVYEKEYGTSNSNVNIAYLIKNSSPATQIEITTYMAALGFDSTEKKGCYTNSKYKVWDLLPRNVLKDNDGDIFVIDAEIEFL